MLVLHLFQSVEPLILYSTHHILNVVIVLASWKVKGEQSEKGASYEAMETGLDPPLPCPIPSPIILSLALTLHLAWFL